MMPRAVRAPSPTPRLRTASPSRPVSRGHTNATPSRARSLPRPTHASASVAPNAVVQLALREDGIFVVTKTGSGSFAQRAPPLGALGPPAVTPDAPAARTCSTGAAGQRQRTPETASRRAITPGRIPLSHGSREARTSTTGTVVAVSVDLSTQLSPPGPALPASFGLCIFH